jgi:hypothetical protein
MRFCNISLLLATSSITMTMAEIGRLSRFRNRFRNGSLRRHLKKWNGGLCVSNEKELRQALVDAKSGDDIEICKGKTIPVTKTPIDLTKVASDVTLRCQDTFADSCFIVGADTPNLFSGTPNYITFDYIAFKNQAVGNQYAAANGACHNFSRGGQVFFANCHFSYCQTEGQGGAIYASQSTVHVDRSRFDYNSAKKDGGALWLSQAVAAVTDTDFVENERRCHFRRSFSFAILAQGHVEQEYRCGERRSDFLKPIQNRHIRGDFVSQSRRAR